MVEFRAQSTWRPVAALAACALVAAFVGAGSGCKRKTPAVAMEQQVQAAVPTFVAEQVAPKVLAQTAPIDWASPTEPRPVWTEFHGTVRGTGIRVTAIVSHDAPAEEGKRAPAWWNLDRVLFTVPQPKPRPAGQPPTAAELRALGLNPSLVQRLRPAGPAVPLEQVARESDTDFSVRANVPAPKSGADKNGVETVVTVTGGTGNWPQGAK